MPETFPGGFVAATIADAITAEREVIEGARRAIRAAEDTIRGAEQRIRESTSDPSPITVVGPAVLPANVFVAGSAQDPQPAVIGVVDAPLSGDAIPAEAPAPAAVLGDVLTEAQPATAAAPDAAVAVVAPIPPAV